MSGTGYVPLPAPVTADPGFWQKGVENLNALRDQQAKQASADAYRQSLNPDGTVNTPKYNALIASGPGAWNAGELMRQQGAAGIAQTGAAQGQFNLATGQNNAVNAAVTAALASPDDQLKATVAQQAQRLVAAGVVPHDRMMQSMLNLSNDPVQLRQQLKTIWAQTAPPEIGQAMRFGQPVTIDQGTGVTGGMRDVTSGAITAAGQPVPVYAPPGTQGQPVHWTTSDGLTHDGTWAQYNVDRGNGRVVGQVSFGAAGGPPAAPAASGTQAQPGVPNTTAPPRLNPPTAAQPAQPAAAGVTPKLTDTTQPEPGMAAKWDASAKQYNADNELAGSYQQRVFPLVQAASILKSGDVTTGQGAEALNRVKSFLATMSTSLGADAQTIQQADFDKVGKYLQQYVNLQGMSGRSDQALASAVSGNPSAHISTLANEQILPAMLGMERMRQMIISDFKAQGGSPRNYSDYASDWQNKHDPRAFVFDMLDNDQRQKIAASLKTPAQRKAFSDTLDIVERNPGIMGQAVMPGH